MKFSLRESNGVGGSHPQLFRSMSKEEPAFYFPVKVAHPPNATPANSVSNSSGSFFMWISFGT
jgi:hypothetical protein